MEPVNWLPDWLAYLSFVIWLNQTLIAGALATFSAFATILHLNKQIEDSKRARAEQLKRRHRMLRAGLPSALSELSAYAERCTEALWFARHNLPSNVQRNIDFDIRIPTEALNSIQRVVETADKPAVEDLEKLLRFFQIQSSRFRRKYAQSFDSGILHHEERGEMSASGILDALFLAAGTSRLFAYARGETDTAENWLNAEDAEIRMKSMLIPPQGGTLPGDIKLKEYFELYWKQSIERYG